TLLKVGIRIELSYTYALLEKWVEAKEQYGSALSLLESDHDQLEDLVAYTTYRALILETASQIHFKHGQALADQGDNLEALAEYAIAYSCVQEEIALLEGASADSELLVIARINAGDYLLA